jgi:hypothetical protein
MSLARVQFFSISLDGFATGEVRRATHRSATPANGCTNGCSPRGGGTRWSASRAAATASTTPSRSGSLPGSAPRSWVCEQVRPPRMARGPRMEGRVGSQPAVPHTDVHPHSSPAPVDRDGGRHDVHFIDASPAEALETAREAADGQDLRLGGSPAMIRDFLAAGLVDHMHIVVVRSCSAEAYASGTDWRASRRTTRSRPPPRPAKSRIGHSSVRVAAREPDHDRARRPGHPLGLRRVHGIAQMRDTHTGDDCRIPEDGRCVREVVEQPHSCA